MNKKVIMGFLAGMLFVIGAIFLLGSDDDADKKQAAKAPATKASASQAPVVKPAASPTAQPAAQSAASAPAAKDYRKYLTVQDLANITGSKFSMEYADMKFSGKPDLTYFTADEGHAVLTVTVLPANYYDTQYNALRSQDYKSMENAFWGPKTANPPRLLGFRKGDATIIVTRHPDAGIYPISVEMMERIAKTIAARL